MPSKFRNIYSTCVAAALYQLSYSSFCPLASQFTYELWKLCVVIWNQTDWDVLRKIILGAIIAWKEKIKIQESYRDNACEDDETNFYHWRDEIQTQTLIDVILTERGLADAIETPEHSSIRTQFADHFVQAQRYISELKKKN